MNRGKWFIRRNRAWAHPGSSPGWFAHYGHGPTPDRPEQRIWFSSWDAARAYVWALT